jgi:hypothetical protein
MIEYFTLFEGFSLPIKKPQTKMLNHTEDSLMKKFSIIAVLAIVATLSGCSSSDEISGRSIRTAYKSVAYIKRHLPTEQQVEFEVSFWTIRDAIKDDKELLSKVGGKKPEEVIAIAKEIYQEHKNAGAKEYQQFTSWDQMIAKYGQERIDQTKHKKSDSKKDEANDLMYKL